MEQTSRIACSGGDGATQTVYIGHVDAMAMQFPDDAMSLPTID